jgi:dTDP-L-rhamnose 4-epimerase
MISALEDVDTVVHCAAAVGVGQSLYRVKHYVDVNVGGTATLLQALIERKQPLRKLVVLTSMTGYGEGVYKRLSDGKLMRADIRTEKDVSMFGWEPRCPETGEELQPAPTPEDAEMRAHNIYALTKRYQEELVTSMARVYGWPVICLRLFNVYGPRQSLSNPYTGVLAIFMSRFMAHKPPVIYEDGNQTRDFVSVHDVSQAVMLALQSSDADGEIINIGSGTRRRIQDCANALRRLLGKDWINPVITHKFRKGDIRHCYADIDKARRLLGFSPSVPWEEGLAELVEWASPAPTRDGFVQAEQELREHGLIH